MVCKKCGAQLNEEFEICPKCGNRIKKKSGLGKILGITLVVLLIGVGVFLYASGYYKNILTQFGVTSKETVTTTADVGDGNTVVEAVQKEETAELQKKDNNVEDVPEKPDMLTQYITELTIEPLEMIIGESHLVELEQEIPNAVWSSTNENVILVTDGQLKALMPGNATVTLSTNVKDISFDVMVSSFPDITLAVEYSATMEINDSIHDVRWESSAPEIVSVEDGVITSLTSGVANITAYIGDVSYTFEVVATTPDITTTAVRKIIGNTEQVSILGTNGKAEWKSDNTAIATVSDTGLITAEPTGAGQSTVVHAYIDGMEFKIDVAVEPIPQLSSTYKMHGHQDNSTYKNAKISICTNANEIIRYTGEAYPSGGGGYVHVESENVLNVADVDYSNGDIYPVYHAFYTSHDSPDDENRTDIYLVGTSQTAEVLAQKLDYYYDDDSGLCPNLSKATSVVTYEPCENYGIIHIYDHDTFVGYGTNQKLLITVLVDEYQYQFVVAAPVGSSVSNAGRFDYKNIDKFPPDYMVEECSVDEVIVHEKVNVNYSALQANSRTYFGGDEWVERIGTKFIEAVEDEAISMAAGYLIKAIFL